ncbi:MAG: DUF3006 family protein, partial [Candidatus Spyradocola sp.]
ENLAFIEGDDGSFPVDRALLSPDAAEGDILIPTPDGRYEADKPATLRRRARLRARLSRLQKD